MRTRGSPFSFLKSNLKGRRLDILSGMHTLKIPLSPELRDAYSQLS